MKNFTQKFIGLLALVYTMSFNATSQDLELDYLGTNVLDGKEQSTYQLFLSVPSTSLIPDPSEILTISIYGGGDYDDSYITTSTSFYNHEALSVDVGAGYNSWPQELYGIIEGLQFDSWLTIGNSPNTQSVGQWIFDDNYIGSDQDPAGSAIYAFPGDIYFGEFELNDGSIKIPIGQFTTDGELNVNLSCSIILSGEVYDFQNLNAQAGGVITGCTDSAAFNYNPIATEDDMSCVAVVNGCLNELALNYNTDANSDDGSCIIEGCTDIEAFNYNEQATENDGSCVAVINGCMDELACNYNSEANTDDSSCYSADQYYDCNEVCLNDSDQDGVCDEIEVVGCTDSEAFNYNDEATDDNGSCVAVVNGCMDSSMSNYNSEANTDDGSCVSWEELANSLQSELDNVVIEDGVSQADLDDANAAIAAAQADAAQAAAELAAAQTEADELADQLAVAMGNQEDGIGQEDVDAAFDAGVASVEVPECEEVATQNIPLYLPQGWSMFGYTCLESLGVVEAFSDISDNIEIVKDEWGLAYLPAWGFSAFDNLEFGEGYQIKMIEEVTDFQFCTTIAGGASQEELNAAMAEVHAMYEGWCESDLDNDGICDVDEVSGCMDASSCNYVSEAEFDDGSCDYESCLDECGIVNGDNSSCTDACGVINGDNSTCLDECGVPNGDNSSCTDACGVINGDNSTCVDECGVPNGDNSSCTDACGVINGDNSTCVDECATNVCLFLTPDGELMYDSAEDIGGFQFSVGGPGGAPVAPDMFFVGASGGASADAGFTISNNGSSVLGFSFSGAIIPAGSGTLLVLEISGGYPFCLSDLIMVGQDGSELTTTLSCEF